MCQERRKVCGEQTRDDVRLMWGIRVLEYDWGEQDLLVRHEMAQDVGVQAKWGGLPCEGWSGPVLTPYLGEEGTSVWGSKFK